MGDDNIKYKETKQKLANNSYNPKPTTSDNDKLILRNPPSTTKPNQEPILTPDPPPKKSK